MVCPVYTNPTVRSQFNEIVEALGGMPMTEEEFRDSALRNQRTGSNYAAMEAAYRIWNLNNGNPIDCTPNMQEETKSILFQNLLDLCNGDRQAAIREKSKIYSKSFREWFGDWTQQENRDNVSKVTDANGEPIVVWHHTDDESFLDPELAKFSTDHDNYFSKVKGGTKKAIFFDEEKTGTLNRKYDIPVYLNIRDLAIYTGTKEDLHKAGTSYTEIVNESAAKNDMTGGLHMQDFDDNGKEHQSIWIVHNANQAKAAMSKNGTYSKKDDRLHYKKLDPSQIVSDFKQMDYESVFNPDVVSRLKSGEIVSSRDIVQSGVENGHMFNGPLANLANILARHDVPVKISLDMPYGVYATTYTFENGAVGITINGQWINQVSQQFSGQAILHELIHAVTTKALNRPETALEREFKTKTEKVFNDFKSHLQNEKYMLSDVYGGTYAINDIHEFVAEFLTNPTARDTYYSIAREISRSKKGFVQRFKNFVNSVAKLFVNKNIFNNAEDNLKQYEQYFYNYLNNVGTIQEGRALSKAEIKRAFDSIDPAIARNEAIVEGIQDIKKFNRSYIANNIELFGLQFDITRQKTTDLPLSEKYNEIENTLQSRINALTSSNLNEGIKQTLIVETKSQLDMLRNPEVTKYEAISNLIKTMAPRILETMDSLEQLKIDEDRAVDAREYMYQMHDNVGMFESIIRSCLMIVQNDTECDDIVAQFNELNQNDPIQAQDVKNFKSELENLAGVVKSSVTLLENMRDRVAVNIFADTVTQSGSLEGADMLNKMCSQGSSIENDISWFEVQFGQADASTNEIVRAVAHIIQQANDKVDDAVLKKALELLQLQGKLGKGEKVTDLYEMVDGQATGYLVRDINFGKFRKDYEEFLAQLNAEYGLAAKNTVPPTERSQRVEWNKKRNAWLEQHAERKYNAVYYEKWANLSTETKNKLDKISGSIQSILLKYNAIDENGIIHYEDITDEEDWNDLQLLWAKKRLLRSPYDEFGNKKTGIEAEEAEQLNDLYTSLYGKDYKEKTKQIDKWQARRNQIIEECGGQQQYEYYQRGLANSFDFEKLDAWDARNSKWEFTRTEDGKAVVFDIIEQEMNAMKINFGQEYEDLKAYAKELLRPYYDLAGEVNDDILPKAIKNKLANEVYPKMYEIKQQVVNTVPGVKQLQERYQKIFDQYLKTVDTRYYKKIQSAIIDELEESGVGFDFDLYELMLGDYGYTKESFGMFETIPNRWLQTLRAKDAQYMKLVPNNAWQEQEEDQQYVNKNWVEQGLDKYNEAIVPKKNLYDNSAQMNKILNSQALHDLYDAVVETMHNSNELQTNRSWTNDYQLPGVTAKLYERMKRAPFWKRFWILCKWCAEKLGFHGVSDQDAKLADRTTVHDQRTEEGEEILSPYVRTIGRHPDGREYSALPQYYTRRLDHPENISYALIDIVLSYYKMSVNYNEKNAIKDKCEAMLDFVKSNKYGDSNNAEKAITWVVKHVRGGDSVENSRVYEQLKNLLDLGLYGKVRRKFENKWFSVSTVFSTIQKLTTASNLGWNRKVAAVGFLTAIHAHLLNALVGKEYNVMNLVDAGFEVMKQTVLNDIRNAKWKNILAGVNNDFNCSKVKTIMREFGIASQLENLLQDTEMGQLTKMAYQHHTFGYLATIDYLTKSQITVAALQNYKYVDGKIYSNLDIQYMRHDNDKYIEMSAKYKKAPSIYKLMDTNGGTISFSNPDVQKAWNQNKGRIKAKCVKQSEKADGVATGLQRAAIQQSWIGMFIMIHRQFLPLMLHERVGQRVYDYDTEEYTHGQFRVGFKYLQELMYNTWVFGTLGGVATGCAFLGPTFGIAAGIAAGLGLRIWGKTHGKNKSFKQINEEFFNNFSSQKDAISSVENRYAIKQLGVEKGMMWAMSYFVVNPICAWADDDKDDFWLQTFAYWLKASQWEINAPYNLEELIGAIKSPTAATALLDRVMNFNNQFFPGLFTDALYNLSLTDTQADVVGKNSPYEGIPRWIKSFIQIMGGYHNEFEQSSSKGVKGKRKYIERQFFREEAGQNKEWNNSAYWLYNW